MRDVCLYSITSIPSSLTSNPSKYFGFFVPATCLFFREYRLHCPRILVDPYLALTLDSRKENPGSRKAVSKGREGAGSKLTDWLRWFSDIDTIRREAVGHGSSRSKDAIILVNEVLFK